MQEYSQYVVYIDGLLLAENTEVDFGLEGDDQDVFTIVQGFSGQSTSPKKIVANFTDMVPLPGLAFDSFTAALEGRQVEVRFVQIGSGNTVTSQGFIRKPKITAGVGKASNNAYEFHGGPGAPS